MILFSSGTHEPQFVPARRSCPIASGDIAASVSTASRILASPTPKQAHTSGPASASPLRV